MTIKEAFEKLTATSAAAMKNPFFVMRKLHDAFADIADKIEGGGGGGSTVEVTQVLESGTKIATITVDDTPTDLYAPSNAVNYSTTEHVVGKWIDGTTNVYERSYTLNNIAFVGQNLVIDATLTKSNCEIVGINGYIYTSSGNGTTLNGIAGIDDWSIGPYLSDSFVIYAGNATAVTQYAGGSLNCTVRYIKKA